jgi:hypothetical protein
MSHGTEHNLEESEHAKHARYAPYDRRVAMTMAIVAACLACVSMASHRAHNETMREQIEANNRWNYQNTKKTRSHLYGLFSEVVPIVATTPEASASVGKLKEIAAKEAGQAKEEEATARRHEAAAEHAHQQSFYYDSGQLGLELGLVLCSIAVLSRQRWFWFSGIAVSIAGAAVAVYGLTVALHPVHPAPASHATLAPLPGPGGVCAPSRMS